MLVLDKSFCWRRSTFDDVTQWNECKTELKYYYIKFYVQTKSRERDNGHENDNDEQISEHIETDEYDDSDKESDADGRFSFHKTVPDEVPLKKKYSRKQKENE